MIKVNEMWLQERALLLNIYICWLYIRRVSQKSTIFLPVQCVQAIESSPNVTSGPHSNFVQGDHRLAQ